MAFLSFGKVIMESFFKKPATSAYPFKPLPRSEAVRGSVDVNMETCVFCGICATKCPADAINVDKTNRTWEINRNGCILCNCCVELCPKKCLSMNSKLSPPSHRIIKDVEQVKVHDIPDHY